MELIPIPLKSSQVNGLLYRSFGLGMGMIQQCRSSIFVVTGENIFEIVNTRNTFWNGRT